MFNAEILSIDFHFFFITDCTGKNLIRCHPSDDHFCISDTLKNDGIHNCMWPSDADEPNRRFPVYNGQQQQQQTQQGNTKQKSKTNDAINMHTTKHSAFYFITLAILIIPTIF